MTTRNRPWRQEIELLQNYSKNKTFTKSTSSGDAEIAVDVAAAMQECNKVSFVVENGPAYIAFDEDATTETMLVPQDEVYFDDSVYIGSKSSILRASGTNARIRGIIWGR